MLQTCSDQHQQHPLLNSLQLVPMAQQQQQQQPQYQQQQNQQPQQQQQQQQQQPQQLHNQQPHNQQPQYRSFSKQQGNPVLKHIRNVRWQLGDIIPDYLLGASTAALFLSLRYHLLKPDYILGRIKEVQRAYRVCVVLVHLDVEDVNKPLAEVTKAALLNDCTLLCAWSAEECGRYLETLKSYETKPASSIQERTENDYSSRLAGALTSLRGINKTDSVTLGTSFGSLADIFRGGQKEFSACPGLGPTKVRRLMEAFNEPFRKVLRTQPLPLPAASGNPTLQGTQQPSPSPGAAGRASAAAATNIDPAIRPHPTASGSTHTPPVQALSSADAASLTSNLPAASASHVASAGHAAGGSGGTVPAAGGSGGGAGGVGMARGGEGNVGLEYVEPAYVMTQAELPREREDEEGEEEDGFYGT
ncbi:MAG: hypothetical protein WDW38_008509 [Sanguina aurantia]